MTPRRTMRFSSHHEGEVAVVSTWRGDPCASSFRLDCEDVPSFIETLVRGLVEQPARTRASVQYTG